MTKFSHLRAMREQRAAETEAPPIPEPAPAASKVGRPPGKRSNPDYQQVTLLLRGQTYTEVRKRLLDQKKDVSTLIDELLDDWLKG